MRDMWSPRGRVLLEREFWIAVLRAQKALGLDVPSAAIEAYERVKNTIDLARIRDRERQTRHDVKARIDEFCALAGYEHIHKGLTSRDLTENVEQLLIARSLRLILVKHAAAIGGLAGRVRQFRSIVLTGRTHNVPAQLTTLGKRLAMFGTEMLQAHATLEQFLVRYPLRGLKGAIGTQLDLLTLFSGDEKKVAALERQVAELLGFATLLPAVGQVYPRSLDFGVVSVLYQLAAGPSSFATTVRLMAGADLVSEGYRSDQVGSSAMPHKVNSRTCERITGLRVVLSGYVTMASAIAGDQWNEGDVSCSVVRRVALPGAIFALDGLLEGFGTVIREFEAFPAIIAAECERFAPFLATTTILMKAVQRGAGREQAHDAIRSHAIAVAREIHAGRASPRDLMARLASDARVKLSGPELDTLMRSDETLTGAALLQADVFVEQAEALVDRVPGAASFAFGDIL